MINYITLALNMRGKRDKREGVLTKVRGTYTCHPGCFIPEDSDPARFGWSFENILINENASVSLCTCHRPSREGGPQDYRGEIS